MKGLDKPITSAEKRFTKAVEAKRKESERGIRMIQARNKALRKGNRIDTLDRDLQILMIKLLLNTI